MAGGGEVTTTKVPQPTSAPDPKPIAGPNKTIEPTAERQNAAAPGSVPTAPPSGADTPQKVPDEKSATQDAMCNPDGTIKNRQIPNCTTPDQTTGGDQTLGTTLVDGVTTGFSNTPQNTSDSLLPKWVTDKKVDTTEPDTESDSGYASRTTDEKFTGIPGWVTNNTSNESGTKNSSTESDPDGLESTSNGESGKSEPRSNYVKITMKAVRDGYNQPSSTPGPPPVTKLDNGKKSHGEKTTRHDRADKKKPTQPKAPHRLSGHGSDDRSVLEAGEPTEPRTPWAPEIPGKADATSQEKADYHIEHKGQSNPVFRWQYSQWKPKQREYEKAKARYDASRERFTSASTFNEANLKKLESGKTVRVDSEQVAYLTEFLNHQENKNTTPTIESLSRLTEGEPQLKKQVGNAMYIVSSEQVITADGKRGSVNNLPDDFRSILESPLEETLTDSNGATSTHSIENIENIRKITSLLSSSDVRYRNSSDISTRVIERSSEMASLIQTWRDSPSPLYKIPDYDDDLNKLLRVGTVDRTKVRNILASDKDGTKVIDPLLNHDWKGRDTGRTLSQQLARETNSNRRQKLKDILDDYGDLKDTKIADPQSGINLLLLQLESKEPDKTTQIAINNVVHNSNYKKEKNEVITNRDRWVNNPGMMQTLSRVITPYLADLGGQDDYQWIDQFELKSDYVSLTSKMFSDPVAASLLTDGFRWHQDEIAKTYGRTRGKEGNGLVYGALQDVLEKSAADAFNEDINRRTYAATQSYSDRALVYDMLTAGFLTVVSGAPKVGIALATAGYTGNPAARQLVIGSGSAVTPDSTKEELIRDIERANLPGIEDIAMAYGVVESDESLREIRVQVDTTGTQQKIWDNVTNMGNNIILRKHSASTFLKEAKVEWQPPARINGVPKDFSDLVTIGKGAPAIDSSEGLLH